MSDLIRVAWFAAGLVAGVAHAAMLWRAAHHYAAWAPIVAGLRVGVVIGVLVVAALAGAILVAAAGWAAGFALLGTWLVASRSHRSVASTHAKPHE